MARRLFSFRVVSGNQMKVRAKNEENILARIALPYADPKDPTRYASTHSDPPGKPTEYPSLVINEYGEGRVIYSTASIEAIKKQAHRNVFHEIIKRLSSSPFSFEANLPKPVEMTLFNQRNKNQYLINFINFQKELPNIPVKDRKIRLRVSGGKKILSNN